tara:strand:+ start:540 stop:1199 length:660 start_codon:yes stop_codon:yes gene_type:complete
MISILIPIYNGIEFIDESVNSVIEQTYEDWELIIAVNGHPENSEVFQIAKKYEETDSRIRVYDMHNLKGKSVTLNEMIKLCNHDYVALLDVDDIWLPTKLEFQVTKIQEYDVVGTQCVYFGNMNGIVPKIPLGDISNQDFRLANPIINSSCIIRKDLCYWGEDGLEDYELWARLRKLNKKFYNFSEILVKHRIHPSSAFNTQNFDEKLNKIKNSLNGII